MAGNGQDRLGQHGYGPDGRGWLPEEGAMVCCLTADGALLEECARVAAVAGVAFEGASAAADAPSAWREADVVLIGPDVPDLPPQRRAISVLVGRTEHRPLLWERAAALGVDHVAELPDAAGWLVEFLARRGPDEPSGGIVGIVGGCGGAGASTTATLLAAAAAFYGAATLLVDGDRLGGGLEARVRDRPGEGLSWSDLASASGAINPRQLAASLPRVGGTAVLSWPAGPGRATPIPPSAIGGALDAARSAFDLVVVDVGRGREGLEDFGWASDQILVVLPGTIGAALSAAQLLHELPPVPLGAVVRGRTAEGIDAEKLGDLLACPLVARVPHLRRAAAAAGAGRLMDLARHRSVRTLARTVLDAFADPARRAEPLLDDGAALAVGARLASRGRRAVR